MGTLQMHAENIFPIIKKWLYSDKDIFVRELVSNACDALSKLQILQRSEELDLGESPFEIHVLVNRDDKTIRIIDNGIGMTANEVEQYIAQVAFSGAESFMQKYQTSNEKDQIIGHFGLGFFSAYMVASSVEIHTLSYKEGSQAVHWKCDEGSFEYTLDSSDRQERGTEIILHVAEEHKEYLQDHRIEEILRRYCSFLPFPLHFGDVHVNNKEPLWLKSASECSEEDYLEFYRHLYPMDPDPSFWVHLDVDYPFHMKGVLYFPKLDRRHMNERDHGIQLFCNRIFVTKGCQDLLPSYLDVLKGAIDSPDIPLNVSRSFLQMNPTVRQISAHIAKKIADQLKRLFNNDRDRFLKIWSDTEAIIKVGAMQDTKFFRMVEDILVWKSLDGTWKSLKELSESNTTIFYVHEDRPAPQLLDLYKDRGVELIEAHPLLDSHFFLFIEREMNTRFPSLKFQRVDAELHSQLIDTSKGNDLLDVEGKTEATKLVECAKRLMSEEGLEIEAKGLHSKKMFGVVLMNEQQRRLRDIMNTNAETKMSGISRTLVLNTNHPLCSALPSLEKRETPLAQQLMRGMYRLVLLGQREMPPEMLKEYVEEATCLMMKAARIDGEEEISKS